MDLLEAAWGLIANAHHGEWADAPAEWREAAGRWRDSYHEHLRTIEGNRVGPSTPGSQTSRQAALDNFPRSGSQRRRVLDAITAAGEHGATRDELAQGLDLPDSGTDARVWELKGGGFVVDTERTRLTRLGEPAAVLVATSKAHGGTEHSLASPVARGSTSMYDPTSDFA